MNEKWIVPANPKLYDVDDHFKYHNTIIWRNMFSIKKDDVVYLYFSSPIRQIKYKCRVVQDIISEEVLLKNSYAISKKNNFNYFSKKEKYIELEPILSFPSGILTYEQLKEKGLGQVQIQARIDRVLREYIETVEKNICAERGDENGGSI